MATILSKLQVRRKKTVLVNILLETSRNIINNMEIGDARETAQNVKDNLLVSVYIEW
jgi:hypothetical protein